MRDIALLAGVRLLTTLCLLSPGLPSRADVWTLQPAISLEESLTDNVRLAPEGESQSDWITLLTPGILVQRSGNRVDLTANYRLQGVFYRHNDEDNKAVNLLDASATGELMRERLFVDASATLSEQNISNMGALAVDNTSISDTRAKVATYRISPYWRESLGNFMDAEFRYERNAIQSGRLLDSDNNIFSAGLASSTAFTRLLWDLRFRDDKIDYQVGDSTRFRNISADIQYLFTPKTAFKAVAGYDDNEYANNSGDIDGYMWQVGGVYKPSRRTSVEAGFGERYFGRDILIEVSHRFRRIQWNFSFNRRPDTPRSILLEQAVFPLNDPFGNPLLNRDPSVQGTLDVNVPLQTAEVFIRERLNGALNYTYRNNALDLSVFRENRESQLTGLNDENYGTDASWAWSPGRRTISRLTLQVSTNKTLNNDSSQDFRIVEYKLTRTIGPELDGSLTYRHVNVDSNSVAASYIQNSFSVSLSKQF